MEEKRKDLKNTKQKKVIDEILLALSKKNPSFYYLSTIEVAAEIKDYIQTSEALSRDDSDMVSKLSRRDIQIMLSLH